MTCITCGSPLLSPAQRREFLCVRHLIGAGLYRSAREPNDTPLVVRKVPDRQREPKPLSVDGRVDKAAVRALAREFVEGSRESQRSRGRQRRAKERAPMCARIEAGFGPCVKPTVDHGAWCSDGSRMWRRG